MMSGHGVVLCASVILPSLLLPTLAVLTLPGYGVEFEHTICKDQIGGDSIRCEPPRFIWIHEEYVGYTPNYVSGADTSCAGGNVSCRVQITSHHIATTYVEVGGMTVPNVTVPCDNTVYEANYLIIYYSCIRADQFDRINMCSSSVNVQSSAYLATPNFPSRVPSSDHDCTCHIQSSTNPGDQFQADLFLLYAGLPEPSVCGEQTWAENEDGLEITRKCSPGWTQLRSIRLQASRITLRFVKNASNDYEGGEETKAWYGVDADTSLSITCLEGSVSGGDPGSIDIQAGSTSAGAIVMTTEMPDATEVESSQTGDQDGGSLSTTTLLAIVAAVAVVLITAMVVVAIFCVRRSRKPAPPSSPPTATEVLSHPAENRYTPTHPDYEQIEYEKMTNRTSGYVNPDGQLQEGDYINAQRPPGMPPKPPQRPPFRVMPDVLSTDVLAPLPASHPRAPDLPPEVPDEAIRSQRY